MNMKRLTNSSMLGQGFLIIAVYSVLIFILLAQIPAERSLGNTIRLVFFHVSLSNASIYAFYLSAFFGLLYLVMHRLNKSSYKLADWSLVLGRVTIVVWAMSVVISILAMQLAWGQIVLTEPLTIYVLIVLALAVGKELIIADRSSSSIAYANILLAIVITVIKPFFGRVMHPENPIGSSDVSIFKVVAPSAVLLSFFAMIIFTKWYINHRLQKRQTFLPNNAPATVVAGKKFRHYKGNEYIVLHIAKHTETLEELVVYCALTDDYQAAVWARPLSMFTDTVVIDGEIVKRFKELD